MDELALTLEDVLAAARFVAMASRAGADPDAAARLVREAARLAHVTRRSTGRIHPVLGDGSISAAASALAVAPPHRPPIGMPDLLRALGHVSAAWNGPSPRRKPRLCRQPQSSALLEAAPTE